MGFTIEDLNLLAKDRYQMEFIAGKKGWSNSISWILMLEDTAILRNFSGKELAVTTGLGFDSTEKLEKLVMGLAEYHASGLIINTGEYISEIPEKIKRLCDENDLPLMTVPWEVYLVEMIKDISLRLFIQGTADEEITKSFVRAIEQPGNMEPSRKNLLPYFDVEGEFQVVLITTEGLAEMDTVERKRLSYRFELFLENITHNGSFFYYDGNFVLVMNDVGEKDFEEIVTGMIARTKRRLPDLPFFVGAGNQVKDLANLHTSYSRALAAVTMAHKKNIDFLQFKDMGFFRLLYAVKDEELLKEMGEEPLRPLLEYDQKHNSNYVETLENYIKFNGSIQAVSDAMYTHRNTVIYRIANIKKLLNSELDSTEDRFLYQLAFYIRNM